MKYTTHTIGEQIKGFELKGWFITSMDKWEQHIFDNYPEIYYVKETEKAIYVNIVSTVTTMNYNRWIPKSAIVTDEEKAIRKLKEEANWRAYQERQARGLEKYEKLLEFAKSTGVPGIKKRMKTATIKNILAEAGIKIPRDLL